jgi:hypothetical protein
MIEKMINYIVSQLRNIDVSTWQAKKLEIAKKNIELTPEVRVVEALRAYIDGVWAGKVEAARLWDNVLIELKELDAVAANRIEERISKSRITDAVVDWRRTHVK